MLKRISSFNCNFRLPCGLRDLRKFAESYHSSFSTPTFLTFGFQILSGIHAGAFAGFFTCMRSPWNMCTFFVPLSRSLISVTPLLAAFRAACLGDVPVKTPLSLPFLSLRAKFLDFFSSFSAMVVPPYKDMCPKALV